jgi:hypothetical protein
LRIQRDEGVSLEFGEGDVLGLVCRRPSHVTGDIPRQAAENRIPEQTDLELPDLLELLSSCFRDYLTAVNRFVKV